VNSKKALRGAI